MNPLRTLENMIAGLVEGTFGRVFKAEVRPMELAHKLAREMDENKTTSVSRVYAPNEYSVWLSPRDRARYEGVEQEVIDELCAYLLEHARGENLALLRGRRSCFTPTRTCSSANSASKRGWRGSRRSHTDERGARSAGSAARRTSAASAAGAGASIGSCRLGRRRLGPPAAPPAPAHAEPEEVGNTMIFSNSQRTRDAVEQTSARRRPKALLLVSGRRLLVAPRGATIGRSRDCDIVLEDSSISRRHAELRPGAKVWMIEDLGSTNGVRVNGNTVHGPQEAAHRGPHRDRLD